MILVIGLGNPGREYEQTRHNFGFMVLDALAQRNNVSFSASGKFKADIAEISGEKKVILAKPTTYMNLSGEAVVAIAQFYKISPQDIWVVADDLDLPLGKIRVRSGGETGGHHGLDNITERLGSKDFWRIRLGVRGEVLRREHMENNIDGNQFVMSRFDQSEVKLLERTMSYVTNLLQESLQAGELRAHTHEVDGLDHHAGDQ